jgi:class 3 adenylate cyclase
MPSIRYARRGEDHVAYGVAGHGPPDVVTVPNWLTDVESMLEAPFMGEFRDRVAEYARVVWFDQPGTGHSDPILGEMPAVETFADTIEVVMDAAGIERAALVAADLATAPAVMFAATRPARVTALVAYNGTARWLADEGYPGLSPDELGPTLSQLVEAWGTPQYGTFLAPNMASDPEACEAVARWLRQALSPGMARRVYSLGLRADVRALLGSVSCPALVMASRTAMAAPPLTQAEYLAEHLPQAELAVFDTSDHLPYRPEHREWVNDTIQAFLTGRRPEPSVEDRVLTTVLFTDLVASTEAAARVGDHQWRDQLDDVEAIERTQVGRYKGRLVKTTGDGILATFDGPARAVRCASAITDAVERRTGIAVRAGVHTGEIEIRGADIHGIAVHIAARVMALAGPGQVFASSTVKDLVLGSGIKFVDGGEHELKGVSGSWRLYVLEEDDRS